MRTGRIALSLLLLQCILLAQDAPTEPKDSVTALDKTRAILKPYTRIAHRLIDECSGLEFHQGAYWTHNDSGGRAVLYRSETPDFTKAQELKVPGAEAIDWQAIAGLGQDLLICDIGDSALRRDDLKVYRVRYESEASRLKLVATYAISYQDGRHDAKAAFVIDGMLHIVSNRQGGNETALYRFNQLRADAPNVAVRVGALAIHARETITAGDYDKSTGTLALLSYTSIYTFSKETAFTGKPSTRVLIEARRCEALCFHEKQIVFANEQRDVYLIDNFLQRGFKSILDSRTETELPAAKGEFKLTGKGSAWSDLAGKLPLRDADKGEHLRWLINGSDLLISARFVYGGAFSSTREESGRLGSVMLLMFATEAAGNLTGKEIHLAVGDNGRTGLDLWQLDLGSTKMKLTPLETAPLKGKIADNWFEFEIRIPLKVLFGKDSAPAEFLFNAWGYNLHGKYEVHVAGQALTSFLHPYTWAEVKLSK